MDSNSKSKSPQACTGDRISALPDAILCYILSFLETHEAIQTSLVSPRWKNLWISVPNLAFVVMPPECTSGTSTSALVDQVLLRRGSSNIHRFQLSCLHLCHSLAERVDAWTCTAIRCNVVELDLDFVDHNVHMAPANVLVLPRSLFTCNTLKVLKLKVSPGVVAIVPTSSTCFPSLKYFHAEFFFPKDVKQIDKLFSCCPALEDLIIEGHLGRLEKDSVLNIAISAPRLKRLRIYLRAKSMTEEYQYKIFVNADVPNLEDLYLKENFCASYSFKNAKSLAKAEIAISLKNFPAPVAFALADSDQRILRLLADIINVKHLSIAVPLFAQILGDPRIQLRCPLPTFNNLNHLELYSSEACSWNSLANMLKISPNLKHLEFIYNYYEATDDDEEDELIHEWRPPKVVPVCLLSSLKTICIYTFEERPDDMKVAEYLRNHGRGATLIIFPLDESDKKSLRELRKRVSMLLRGSKNSEIVCLGPISVDF